MAERLKMKIGVLGGNGFLGSNLTRVLRKSHEVSIASRRTGVDATKIESVCEWILSNQLDCVVNLAAQCGGIGLNQTNPYDLWLSTTKITCSVLEAARITKLNKLVMIGTVCSYAKNCEVPFKEVDLMNYGFPEETNAPYGVAKLNGLFGCQSYRKQHGLNAIYLIPVNLYGTGDNFSEKSSHVIPALIRKMLNYTDELTVWGDGTATREFLYAEDCAEAISLAIEHYNDGEPVNLGSGQEISIRDLVEELKNLLGWNGVIKWDASKPNGQPRRKLDVSQAKEKFGFEAKTSLREGLKKTITFFLQQLNVH